jgi:hypothetical protein
MKTLTLLLLTFVTISSCFSQSSYNLEPYDAQKCAACESVNKKMPPEANIFLTRKENTIVLVANNKEWFDKVFANRRSGFAVELVSKDQFVCNGENTQINPRLGVMGYLLPPVYKEEFKDLIIPNEKGFILIKAGTVPDALLDKEIEYNLRIIDNNRICFTRTNFNISFAAWELLDMGMYMDSINYNKGGVKANSFYGISSKQLTFTIPFQKGKAVFSAKDIKPLYDSLKLNKFDIKRISIRAYSSVEGSEERNLDLQQKRASSIVTALRSYQNSDIVSEITTAENWVGFMTDIAMTTYDYMAALSKQEIKQKLSDKKLSDEMEPILQKERMAIVTIEIEKKTGLNSLTDEQLVAKFKQSIQQKNISEAVAIQNQIFTRIADNRLPNSFLDKLEVPRKKEYVGLLNNEEAFNVLYSGEDLYQCLLDFEKLKELMPNNGHVCYNICALKIKTALIQRSMIKPDELLKEINGLQKYNIDYSLIKRMLINYNIQMCEYYMQQQDYAGKDKCLNFILNNYKSIPYSPSDIVCLAQFLVSYAREKDAIKVVEPYVKRVDCDEDILFYYINLTIIRDNITKTPEFRQVLLNAYNVNPKRLCHMFDSYANDGVTFQLLKNDYLKSSYCESCVGTKP